MKITIEKIIIDGTAREIQGLFRCETSADFAVAEVLANTPAAEEESQADAPDPQPESKKEAKTKGETPTPSPAKTNVEAESAPAEEAKTEEAPAPKRAKEYPSPVDVRAAMEAIREKFEHTGDEKKDTLIHRNLTAEFKETAKRYGAEKPSTLDPDRRANFIEALNNINLDEDGNVLPF